MDERTSLVDVNRYDDNGIPRNGNDAGAAPKARRSEVPDVRTASSSRASYSALEEGRYGVNAEVDRERKPFVPKARSNMGHRFKYYTRLSAETPLDIYRPPPHVLPATVFILGVRAGSGQRGTQSSWVTIFSVWATSVGISLLSIPWGIGQAGLGLGLGMVAMFGFLCWYTAWLIVTHGHAHQCDDFSDLCLQQLGPLAQYLCFLSSILIFVGAAIAVHTLLATSLEQIGLFFTPDDTTIFNLRVCTMIVLGVLIPMYSFKSVDVLLRLNSFGVICVIFMICFISYSSISTGLGDPMRVMYPKPNAMYLTGLLVVSFFNHNAVLTITKNQRHPENNKRDLGIAFILIAASYAFVGAIALCAKWHGQDLQQNILQMFSSRSKLALTARCVVTFQLLTLAPLINYVIRVQFFGQFFKTRWPGYPSVSVLNALLLVLSTLLTLYYPNIGTIFRFTGGLCGFFHVFALPVLVHLKLLRKAAQDTPFVKFTHGLIVLIGFIAMVGQFLPSNS